MATVADCITRALDGFDALVVTAEPVEDEFQYVSDLSTVWRGRFSAVTAARGDDEVGAAVEAAMEVLVAEAVSIEDPHRAIDWLSTLPQVALAALGEAG